MTKRTTLLTEWTGAGTHADPFRPAIIEAHGCVSYTDISGQPGGQGGPFQIEAVLTDEQLAAIKADPKHGSAAVLAEEAEG